MKELSARFRGHRESDEYNHFGGVLYWKQAESVSERV